jgi:hypothetical protein
MYFTLFCALVAAALVGIPLFVFYRQHGKRYTTLYCALHGHDPKCSIEDCGVIKFTCTHCKREVGPL